MTKSPDAGLRNKRRLQIASASGSAILSLGMASSFGYTIESTPSGPIHWLKVALITVGVIAFAVSSLFLIVVTVLGRPDISSTEVEPERNTSDYLSVR